MIVKADIKKLKSDIETGIKSLRKYQKGNKRKTTSIALYGGIVSALTTISIGLAAYTTDKYETAFKVAALIFSASLVVVHAWDGLFSHKELWKLQASTANNLRVLKIDIEHMEKSNTLTQVKINKCYIRYKAIFKEHNEAWQALRNIN